MGRPKKINYADMFSYDGNSGLYYCTRTIGLKKRNGRLTVSGAKSSL